MQTINPLLLLGFLIWAYACTSDPHNNPDHTVWADSVSEHAYQLMNKGQAAKAITYIDSAYAVVTHRGTSDLWKKYNVKTSYYTNQQLDQVQRWVYIDSMQQVLQGVETRYPFEYTHTQLEKGSALLAEKKYVQAFKCYYEGRKFAIKNLDQCSVSEFDGSLGTICYQQEEFLKAIPYVKQAYEEILQCPNTTNFYQGFIIPQGMMNTVALCFERAHRPDSATGYYFRALQCIEDRAHLFPDKETDIAIARGVVEGNLGGNYIRLKKFSEAERHLQMSIRINDRPGYAIEDAQTAKTKLADLYLKQNRFAQADSLLYSLEKDVVSGRGKSLENDQVIGKWINLKWKYYEQKNDIAHAYEYMKRYRAFDDSMTQVRSALKHTDLQEVFKDQEHAFEVTLLKKNSEIKTAWLAGAIAFLCMAIVITVVIFYYLKRSGKHIKKLTSLNRQMRSTLTALRQSQEENSRLMKVVAHDLRNPINAMTSIADLMLMDTHRAEDDRNLLEMIKTSGNNSLQLVTDLLQTNAHKNLVKTPVDMEELLQYCTEMLQHKAQQKQQQLVLETSPVTLCVNQEKMWRVITNLIANAIKFSPENAVITIRMEAQAGEVLISVADNGMGIATGMQGKVFDMFTTAQRPGTAGEESFGMGLAVSRQIVEAHGGRIWLESQVNLGTTFYISLPNGEAA